MQDKQTGICVTHKERGAAPLLILGALAALVYLILGQFFSSSPPPESTNQEKTPALTEQQDLIEDRGKVDKAIQEALKRRILVKINVQGNEAWVDSHLWKDMGIEKRQRLLINLAKHFDYEGSLARVNLYNYQSGEKVGTYTLWSGLQFY